MFSWGVAAKLALKQVTPCEQEESLNTLPIPELNAKYRCQNYKKDTFRPVVAQNFYDIFLGAAKR